LDTKGARTVGQKVGRQEVAIFGESAIKFWKGKITGTGSNIPQNFPKMEDY